MGGPGGHHNGTTSPVWFPLTPHPPPQSLYDQLLLLTVFAKQSCFTCSGRSSLFMCAKRGSKSWKGMCELFYALSRRLKEGASSHVTRARRRRSPRDCHQEYLFFFFFFFFSAKEIKWTYYLPYPVNTALKSRAFSIINGSILQGWLVCVCVKAWTMWNFVGAGVFG